MIEEQIKQLKVICTQKTFIQLPGQIILTYKTSQITEFKTLSYNMRL